MKDREWIMAWDQKVRIKRKPLKMYGQYWKSRFERGSLAAPARAPRATPWTAEIRRNSISNVNWLSFSRSIH